MPKIAEPDPGVRGEQTRRLVVDTAVRLFREQGYDKTTMRGIASAAGLSVGNAYYYFPSKEHLVQEFYRHIQEDHALAYAREVPADHELATLLRAAMRTGIQTMAPYHSFAATFIKSAIAPDSPLSPFSAESATARERSLALFRSVVDGTTSKLDAELRAELPELLWLGHLGVTLYWVHDRSPDQAKTHLLIDRATPLVGKLASLSGMRILRPVTREALSLYRTLR